MPLVKYGCSKSDLLLSTWSPRRQEDTDSARSCSESRQALQPRIEISGDLTTSQNSAIRRLWKQEMKRYCDNKSELASRLLLRIFAINPRLQALFHLSNLPYYEIRKNPLFKLHVKAVETTLSFVMLHLYNPTAMSKSLQTLGARHVIHTRIQYKSNYWKVVNQAFIEFVNADQASIDVFNAWNVLGNFCVEQMRIGYKIEYKAQKMLERLKTKEMIS
uniref:GLOBIN domain-containing protein n=1 Tax=Loa loa TaxID=7209 RepID=A0A1I7VR77_LOALO